MTDGNTERSRPPFDFAEVWRLIGEAQRFGFETARNVSARFGDLADSDLGSRAMGSPPVEAAMSAWRSLVDQATSSEAQEQFTAAAQTFGEAFVDMWQAAWQVFTDSTSEVGFGGFTWPTRAGADLGTVTAGSSATGKAYVHVGRDNVPNTVKIRAGSLATGAGGEIPAEAVSVDPDQIDSPDPGRSYEITVTVDVPRDAAPGRYHGFLFALTEPESAVSIHLEVS